MGQTFVLCALSLQSNTKMYSERTNGPGANMFRKDISIR